MEQQNQKPKWVIPVIAILAVLLVGCIVAICYLQISERKEASQPQVTFTAAPTKSPEEETLEKGKKLFEQGDYVTAISTLKSLGFKPNTGEVYSDTVPKGYVVKQYTEAGAQVDMRLNSGCYIEISKGPKE